jgi:hypothetical protein
MTHSQYRRKQLSRTLTEAILALESAKSDIAIKRLYYMRSLLEQTVICPKCCSDEILTGNSREPNHCSKCGHEWSVCKHQIHKHEQVLKSVSLQPNHKLNGLSDKIDSALAET